MEGILVLVLVVGAEVFGITEVDSDVVSAGWPLCIDEVPPVWSSCWRGGKDCAPSS